MYKRQEKITASKIELSSEEIANLSNAEFKTLVIRMPTEMIKLSHKVKDKMKAIQSEIKKNIHGTNSEGRETGTHTNDLKQKEEVNIQPEQGRRSIISGHKIDGAR